MNRTLISSFFEEHISLTKLTLDVCKADIEEATNLIIDCFNNGNKLLLCGNGGSAADCQHIAAEFIGRFENERCALPAISLVTDTSILSALSNDYNFERVFERQIEGIGNKGDILLGITTSGESLNIERAFIKAKEMGLKRILLTGINDTKINKLSDISINIPSSNTARIQEIHILVAHIICKLVEVEFINGKKII